MIKIASPLFILRNECSINLFNVIERLADIGFAGIEFLGLFGHSPADIKSALDSCGLTAVGDHVAYNNFVQNTDRVIHEHKELGCGYITIGSPFQHENDYGKIIESMNRIGESMNNAGMKLLFHNHKEEVAVADNGKTILDNLMDDTNPQCLSLEPDLGWIMIGGGNPVHYLKKYYKRCPVIHFKDYFPTDDGFVFRPTGYGIVDNAGLYALSLMCNPVPEWFVMDHDCAYERDIYDDLELSLRYFRNLMMIH